MTGNEYIELKQEKVIDDILRKNKDKPYIVGYRNFISKSSNTTVYNYIRHIVQFMNYCQKEIENLTVDDYTLYLSSIKETTSSNQIVVYAALKKFSLYLMANNKNTANPMQYIERPKFKEKQETKEKRENGYLDKKEIKKYLETIESGIGSSSAVNRQKNWKERDLLIILIFLNTGMRCSALCKLDVNSINFEKKQLTTIDKGDQLQIYDLPDNIIFHLDCWLSKRAEILGNIKENALFISNRKSRLDKLSVSNIVNKYAGKIKGKHITPHKLRATYGTQLYEATRDLYFTQECMGHASPKTTELYIRGQKEENRKRAADIMSKIIK